MEYKIKTYHSSYKTLWDDFVENSKNGLFFHKRDFMEYHADRFIDSSLLIFKKEKLLAIFPANIQQKRIISHQGLTFGSLLVSKQTKATDVLEMITLIKGHFKSLGAEEVIYKAIPYIFHKYPAEEDLYALFINDAEIYRRDLSSVIKLSEPIRFSETKRQLVKKCKDNGVKIIETDIFDKYWILLENVLSKFNTKPVHTVDEISLLKTRFSENIKLYEAQKDGELLAGIVIFDFGTTVHTQYMAASDLGRKWGALDFINDYLIQEKYKDRQYYSFGISTEEQGKYLNTGLLQQKENMGARAITLDFYSLKL